MYIHARPEDRPEAGRFLGIWVSTPRSATPPIEADVGYRSRLGARAVSIAPQWAADATGLLRASFPRSRSTGCGGRSGGRRSENSSAGCRESRQDRQVLLRCAEGEHHRICPAAGLGDCTAARPAIRIVAKADLWSNRVVHVKVGRRIVFNLFVLARLDSAQKHQFHSRGRYASNAARVGQKTCIIPSKQKSL
eukprot:6199636-Pleurochrysis_carterae.AAC.4